MTWDANGEQVCSGSFVEMGGKVANRCMRLTATSSTISVGGGYEYRAGLLVRY